MKLALAGQSYSNRALAAGAQQCVNLYVETIEDPNGSGKGVKILRGTPGYLSLANLNAHSGTVRGLWSCDSPAGGSRCFAVVGSWLYEINAGGGVIASYDMGLDDNSPVQMFGNGNQLGIVNAGYFYIDNGAGPVKARFQLNGTVSIAGTAVTWVAGDKFPIYTPATADPLPTAVYINGVPQLVTFNSAITATLAVAFSVGTGTVTRNGSVIFWSGGTVFSASWVGMPIVIGGVTYTVRMVAGNGYAATIVETPDGIVYGAAYTVTIANNSYSTAGGPLVGALTGAYMDETFYAQQQWHQTVTYTDLVIDGADATKCTSAAHPFTAADIGAIINITSGAGFTVQQIQISNTSYNVAICDRALGTLGSTGGHGSAVDTGRNVNFSAVLDGTSWSGLDFFAKSGYPDYIQSIYADRGQLYVLGTESSEVWQNDLNTGRPVRLNGAVAREGSMARFATVSMQEHLYFLGGPPGGGVVAYRVDGYTPTRISTHAIEQAWATQQNSSIKDAIAWWYVEDGHYFWVISQIAGDSTWVYDATEKFWHERLGWNGTIFGSYLLQCHAFMPHWGINGQHLVGFGMGANVYVMSSAFSSADGSDVKRVRALPYLYAGGGKRVYCDRLSLDMATGLIPSGTEPTVTLEWSADNGKTWSTPDPAGFGLHDETSKRVYWIAQGSAETSMTPRLSVTGQAAVTLIDAEAEVSMGTS